ncbi:MAG: hypothetical protein B7X06_01640 [Verrucomicrobia bacterium 21-51-4]|nr:MAG: hypothetical protein B7X06_01640 [Verrucomicrobia bacterium 21-51-4]
MAVCKITGHTKAQKDTLLANLLERERNMTTCLGNGLALPHMRLPMKQPYIFAVGRCPNGLEYQGRPVYKDVRAVFLLIAGDAEHSYLNVLASVARLFQEGQHAEALVAAPNITSFRRETLSLLSGSAASVSRKNTKFNRLILNHAEKIAQGADCSSILVFADAFVGGIELSKSFSKFKTLLITENSAAATEEHRNIDAVIPVRSFSSSRLSQLRSAILIGLARGTFKYNDRLCCVAGLAKSNQFDTIVVVDLEREFQSVFTKKLDVLPSSVKAEVVERILAIASELAALGREGRPIGSLFVVGDSERVKPFTKPLVLNPFYGYPEEDRNILNPFMDETVKELSSIDGAFIIRGDGVIESAGSLIHAPNHDIELPSGLGTRHSAAAAISRVTDCLAVVVSSSSGQVVLFRRGQMLPLTEKTPHRDL